MDTAQAIDPQRLSSLIGLIYDCALDPTRWTATLNAVRGELRVANAMLNVWTVPRGDSLLGVMSGIEPAYAEAFADFGPEIVDQWGGPAALNSYPTGEPIVLSQVQPLARLSQNRYYRDWVRPQGLHDFMAVAISRDAGAYCSIGFARHERDGDFDPVDCGLVRLLVPHVQRAIAISRLLDVRAVAAETFAATLDTLSVAVILVDSRMQILSTNAAADRILTSGAATRDRGTLKLAAETSNSALSAAVALAASNESSIGRRGIGIPTLDNERKPLVLNVMPLRQGRFRPGLAPDAAAAIFVSTPNGPPQPPAEAVAALFDLTSAESRVFTLISGGRTVSETASALGINTSTAKTHLLRIFSKTNTRRQADLVRLAMTLAIPLIDPS